MASRALPAIEPEALLSDLLELDPGLRRQAYYGERSIFSNPGGVAPLDTMSASINDRDGPNDKAAKLSRRGVDGLALCLTPERCASLKPLLVESLAVVKAKWAKTKRMASGCSR
jgi:hypothetical protein